MSEEQMNKPQAFNLKGTKLYLDTEVAMFSAQWCYICLLWYFTCYRDHRSNRAALFDGIEEGGIRASAYSSHEIHEHDNDLAIEGLQDRVNILKRVTIKW